MGDCELSFVRTVKKDRLLCNRLCLDLAENIHLHYRDIRLEFSISEWKKFVEFMKEADLFVSLHSLYKEGDKHFHSQYEMPGGLKLKSDYNPDKIFLERQRNGVYHLHYFDLRLEFDELIFTQLRELFKQLL